MKTRKEISDQVAKDALSYSRQFGPVPTHPAMAASAPPSPDASATDAPQDDEDWFDDDDNTQGN